ncbi:hypothetical protein OS493_040343 [Desmophyllum pertusum]|uniref:Uncharacterized protein n=1 Tax=Desmophyllum pertusum TaxID=174260 RepID=A0A9W9YH48_9CNID|nr:hypothetical protein OS493_040343 [Desmophyllum pertusum]
MVGNGRQNRKLQRTFCVDHREQPTLKVGEEDEVMNILAWGAYAKLEDETRETRIAFCAASAGNTALYRVYSFSMVPTVGALDRDNRTPLHAAAYERDHSSLLVALLIQHGADVHLG